MQVKLLTNLRGPEGEFREVYVKVMSEQEEIWYIIPSTDEYETDSSGLMSADTVLYAHPMAKELGLLEVTDSIRDGYTFIPQSHCEEQMPSNNKNASIFLEREY